MIYYLYLPFLRDLLSTTMVSQYLAPFTILQLNITFSDLWDKEQYLEEKKKNHDLQMSISNQIV